MSPSTQVSTTIGKRTEVMVTLEYNLTHVGGGGDQNYTHLTIISTRYCPAFEQLHLCNNSAYTPSMNQWSQTRLVRCVLPSHRLEPLSHYQYDYQGPVLNSADTNACENDPRSHVKDREPIFDSAAGDARHVHWFRCKELTNTEGNRLGDDAISRTSLVFGEAYI